MRRVIGMDIHRTFGEVVFWEDGRLRPAGRVDMTRSGLEGFGRTLSIEDEVVIEATGNAMSVVRVLSPFVGRVIVAAPRDPHVPRHLGFDVASSVEEAIAIARRRHGPGASIGVVEPFAMPADPDIMKPR